MVMLLLTLMVHLPSAPGGQTVSAHEVRLYYSTVSTLLNVTGNADLGSDASDTVTFNAL